MDKNIKVLVPRYISDFKCIGSRCEDSCCSGWKVDIDYNTYKKYRNLKECDLKKKLNVNVNRNRSNNHSNSNYAKIKLKDGICPLLNEDKLCTIQLEKGHEYLSVVCRIYPRIVNKVYETVERSLTMSCPEAARIALLNKASMEFDEFYEEVQSEGEIQNIFSNDKKNKLSEENLFWKVRIFVISLLQNRNYKLDERLCILGMFINNLEQNFQQISSSIIEEVIENFSKNIEIGAYKGAFGNMQTNTTIQLKLLKEVAEKRFFKGITSSRYMECLKEFLLGINYDSDDNISEINSRYKESYNNYYEPFMNESEHILENYLVNYVFKNVFPLKNQISIFSEYMMLILHYSLIKMHLIGIASYHKGLNEELIIKLIQSFAKTVEHNTQYLDEIQKLLVQNNFNTLPYMIILIKN